MRTFLFLLTLLAGSSVFAQADAGGGQSGPLALIPTPVNLTVNAGSFTLPKSIVIEAQDEKLGPVVSELKTALAAPTGYTVNVTTQPAGIFYGIQTLLQLLPAAIESKVVINRSTWQAPCVTITDYPRFGWRGLMLDVSRHFFTKQEVEGFIDEM